MNRLALGIYKGERLVKRLGRGQPLQGRAGRASGEENEELGVVRERNCKRLSLDGVDIGGERKGERGFGGGIEDGGNGERSGVEGEGSGVRGGEREEGGGEDGGGGEVEVERKGDVGGEWMS